MVDLLKENNAEHIKVFGGGGGVIVPEEIRKLHAYGVTRIYSPEDGRKMGLEGMIGDLLKSSDYSVSGSPFWKIFPLTTRINSARWRGPSVLPKTSPKTSLIYWQQAQNVSFRSSESQELVELESLRLQMNSFADSRRISPRRRSPF